MNKVNTHKRKWCLYCHTNKINGKKYFGITCQQPERRWQNGNGYKTKYFYNAIQKYGWNNFDHEIIRAELTLDEANTLESQYIRKYHTCIYDEPCFGYNATFGGDGCVGFKHSNETKEKFKKRVMSQETRDKISKTVSTKNKGHYVSEETKQKLRNARIGFHHTDNTKRKISQTQTGRNLTNEWKDNISRQHIEVPRYNSKAVSQFDKCTGEHIATYFSTGEAQRQTGINNIRACCNRKQKTAGGYIWKYRDEVVYE